MTTCDYCGEDFEHDDVRFTIKCPRCGSPLALPTEIELDDIPEDC